MKLSDSPLQRSLYGANESKFIPFTAFVKINPISGKRFETWRDMERIQDEVETLIETICDNSTGDTNTFDFAKPIAFTPAFGNKPARLTIHGNACVRTTAPKEPVGERYVDNNGSWLGPAASNNSNREPDAELDSIVTSLKNSIETNTGLTIYRMEVANFIYGVGGVHFPL
jgi:hypothetical protein